MYTIHTTVQHRVSVLNAVNYRITLSHSSHHFMSGIFCTTHLFQVIPSCANHVQATPVLLNTTHDSYNVLIPYFTRYNRQNRQNPKFAILFNTNSIANETIHKYTKFNCGQVGPSLRTRKQVTLKILPPLPKTALFERKRFPIC